MKLKGVANKVVSAVMARATDQITGEDMAQLLEMMLGGHIMYENKKEVDEQVEKHNALTDGLIKELSCVVEQHRRSLEGKSKLS